MPLYTLYYNFFVLKNVSFYKKTVQKSNKTQPNTKQSSTKQEEEDQASRRYRKNLPLLVFLWQWHSLSIYTTTNLYFCVFELGVSNQLLLLVVGWKRSSSKQQKQQHQQHQEENSTSLTLAFFFFFCGIDFFSKKKYKKAGNDGGFKV